MELSILYRAFKESKGISTDTRKIEEGFMFFALKGENFDGNKFVEKAFTLGALYCVIDDEHYKINEKCLLVDNVLLALQQLANYHRNQLGIKIISITGTNGKTTTKELVNSVLSSKFKTYCTQGNLNNQIGVPLTLLAMNSETELGIVEMGANHKREIDELCKIAEPDFGLITNVGTAHIEGFGSFKGVIETKTELYRFLESKNGIVFYNDDNEILKEKSSKNKRFAYGTDDGVFLTGKYFDANPFLRFGFYHENEIIEIKSNLIGKYNFENFLAAACIGRFFEVDAELTKKSLENYFPKNNRSEMRKTELNTLLLDMYNANPTSMKSAILNFAELQFSDKVLILGDMLELGNISENEHYKIVELLKQNNFEKVFLVGKEFMKIKQQKYLVFETSKKLAEYFDKNKISSSTILLKASRGIKLEVLIDYL